MVESWIDTVRQDLIKEKQIREQQEEILLQYLEEATAKLQMQASELE